MKINNLSLIIFLLLAITSCSSAYIKGGYYFESAKRQSFYGNDKKHLYIGFSNQYVYNKIGFNAYSPSTADIDLLSEFNYQPKHLLFSYHSSTERQAMAILMSKQEINMNDFLKKEEEKGSVFYYKITQKTRFSYAQNIYPYGNKYILVIEKYPNITSTKKGKANGEKTRIFPEVLKEKP